ncbi:14399_t:CDS:10 [Acaulospora morrowiae]|uniref:14399_t:CDS:1 n=1 Tax=Acaulospora morrowiae TaxID=94023 RepID=A0A9N8WR16_9GLOM|nr:14399_t:CDS:10 [Acaulospora morrowiae]
MTATKVLKDLSIILELTILPNSNPVSYNFQVKKGQMLLDIVRNFMMEHNIPCYLEISVMSTIESLMRESWRRDMEMDSKIPDEAEAKRIRSELVAKYQKHTTRFNDSPSEDVFPKAYHTLVHSPVPSIFDALLQFEQNCKQAIKEFTDKRDTHLGIMGERHQKEVTENGENNYHQLIEDVELSQATWQSQLEELQRRQKREYCNFVLKLYEAHQQWMSEQTAGVDSAGLYKLDGKEIVSKVINEMREQEKGLSRELLRLGQENTARSRPGSISSMADIIHSPIMSPTTSMFASPTEEKKPMFFAEDVVAKIRELGFSNEQAKMALEMTNHNMVQAINLLIESGERVDLQIANAQNMMTRRPSIPVVTPPPTHRRSKSHSRPLALTVLTKQEKKNGWSPMSFLQQQKQNMLASQNNNSSVRKISGWLGKAMNLGSEEGNGHGSLQLDDPQLVESFTISLGNQVKSTHNLRLLASDMDDLLKTSNDLARDMAYRAQTAANLYSQNLTAIVLLLTPRDWPNYKLGKSANKAFFECCKESTEFHFDNVDLQFEAIEKDYMVDGEITPVQEGDFFITRHSNLPLVHVVFHLVIDFESIQKSELTQRSKVIAGLRNILRTVTRFDITSISLPFLLLPSNVDCFSDPTINENLLYRRGELVLKCTKGFMIENSRLPKRMAEKEQETKTVSFLLPKSATEQQFNNLRLLLTGIFRAS